MNFSDSYLGKLRKIVGSRLILIPGARIVVQDRRLAAHPHPRRAHRGA